MFRFHVFIIESPSAPDLYKKRFEGEALEKTLKLSGIETSHRLVVKKEAFMAALIVEIPRYFKNPNPLPLVIHISAHGDDNGIELSNGEYISWDELKELLKPINKAMNGQLLVSISACKSFSACAMAMKDDEFPFLVMVGCMGSPLWSETNIGFATLYHLLSKNTLIKEAVRIMKQASGHDSFVALYSEEARKSYLKVSIPEASALRKLEASVPKEQVKELSETMKEKTI